jgi:hypothetical protein
MQLNGQSFVVRRFIAAGHRSQRPINRATTIEVRRSCYCILSGHQFVS